MKSRRRHTEENVSFQITPMIDMTFLLLIFFMVTTRLSEEQRRMEIRLPVASAAVKPADLSDRDIINIDAEGRFFVGERRLTREELETYLRARLRAHPPLRLYVRADRDMPYEQTRELMRMAAEAGALDVIFGTLRR